MSTPDDKQAAEEKALVDEAHRVATEAVDAVQAFTTAAVNLPADSIRLGLDALKVAADKIKGLMP